MWVWSFNNQNSQYFIAFIIPAVRYFCRTVNEGIFNNLLFFVSYLNNSLTFQNIKKYINSSYMLL